MIKSELKKLMELRNEIMLCGEIYNDCNWKYYNVYNELVKKYNRLNKKKNV